MHAHSIYLICMLFKYGSITLPYKVWNTEAAIDGRHTVEQLSTHSLPTINFILSLSTHKLLHRGRLIKLLSYHKYDITEYIHKNILH